MLRRHRDRRGYHRGTGWVPGRRRRCGRPWAAVTGPARWLSPTPTSGRACPLPPRRGRWAGGRRRVMAPQW